MFRVTVVLALLLLRTTSPAQQTPLAGLGASETKNATVEGQVFNQVTQEPLRRVEVRLLRPQKNGGVSASDAAAYATVTNAEGKFHFDGVAPGTYKVNYRKAGFVVARGGGPGAMGGMKLLTLKAGGTESGLRYYLLPQGIVTGRVVDDEGEPVQGARVMLIRREFTNRMKRMVPHGQASTSDKGEYRITGVVPGQYYILANLFRGFSAADGFWGPATPPKPGQPRMGYVSTWFPNASESEQAIPVTVPPGVELAGQDIALRREDVVKVVGKLVWQGGAPVANAHMIYAPRGASYYAGGSTFATDQNGLFTIDELQPGDYMVMAHSESNAVGATQQRVLQSVLHMSVGKQEVETVTLEWQPEAEASGTFILEGSSGKTVDLAGCTFSLYPSDFNLPVGAMGWATSDGRFRLEQLPPVRFTPNAACPGGSPYVKSILIGEEDVLGKEADGANVAAAGVKVVVRTDVASVSGTLDVPGETKGAIEKPLVALLATDARLRRCGGVDSPEVDQELHFRSRNLRPGEYLVWAFEEGDLASLSDPEFFRLMESKGTKVTLGPGESKSVSLKLLDWPAELADRLQ